MSITDMPSPAPQQPGKPAPLGAAPSRVLNGHELDTLEKARPVDAGKPTIRVAIVSENFYPKVDGVTRTLAKLLEHLQSEGHEALLLGPESGMDSYAGHEVVGTKGIPLLGVYKGLALNFMRPRFIRKLREFKPDVIQFVDPIWLCAQAIPVVQYYFPDVPLVASYHTNLASYSTLFGFSWLTPTMWNLMRNLHGRCDLTFCPSPSTARMLESQGFENVRLWPRGVYTTLFRPEARDFSLRQSWGAEPALLPTSSRRSSLENRSSPPPYTSVTSGASPESKVVMLYVGRISWEKNLRLLVEAFRGLQKPSEDGSRPACQLVFVGDGPSRPELEALCASYGLDAVFMGYRKGQELAAAYASADIFAFPSWTETFGQVVLESLASGLPVVGLRAEGVCDLVKHEETGLLLDMDVLLPSTSADDFSSSASSSSSLSSGSPPTYTPHAAFKPLPENPHALVGTESPTFPLAVSLYRSLLVELATDHTRRREMGRAAAADAATKSWHGAMEMLVDGYRELARPRQEKEKEKKEKDGLSLSRTSTIEVDIVCDAAEKDSTEVVAGSSTGSRRRKLLRLGGVFRRTGGRLRESSMSIPLRSWLGSREGVEAEGESGMAHVGVAVGEKGAHFNSMLATRWFIKLALLSYFFYIISAMVLKVDAIAAILT